MQLQPNRGNLYDDVFNRSIKTVLGCRMRSKREYRSRIRDRKVRSSNRNLHDYFREYIV